MSETIALIPLAEMEPTVKLEVANRALKISRSYGYELAEKGDYPVALLRVGRLYRVPTLALRQYLGLASA